MACTDVDMVPDMAEREEWELKHDQGRRPTQTSFLLFAVVDAKEVLGKGERCHSQHGL
jgi:hypothetical protein